MTKQYIFVFLALIGLVTGSFAYMQRTYVTKDIMDLIISRLERIEFKVDLILQEKAQR